MTAKMPTRRTAAIVAVVALAAAACGGDDGGGTEPEAPDDPASEAAGDDSATGDDGSGDDGSGDDGSGDDGSGDADAGAAPPTDPAVALAEELHPIELPEPGTAVVRLAGETYVFEDIGQCGINDSGDRWSFNASAGGELADGSATFFNVLRTVVDPAVLSPSEWHERDFVQIAVEQDPGSGMSSNAWHDVHRDAPGDPIEGDGDVLPIIFVVDDGDSVAATAIAELSHPPFTGEFDRAGEGIGEFAVNCG